MINSVGSLYTGGWNYSQYQSQQATEETISETPPQPPPGKNRSSSSEDTEQTEMQWASPPPPPPKIDTNEDGSISEDELNALVSDIQEKTGESIDTDTVFSQYDTNGDGVLDESEINEMLESGTLKTAAEEEQSGVNSMGMAGMAPPPRPPEVDTDGDGAWSEDELSALVSDIQEKTGETIDADTVFSQYDIDGDGVLNESEQKELMESDTFKPPSPPTMQANLATGTEESDEDEKTKLIELLLSKYKSSEGILNQDTSSQINFLS